MTEFKVYNDTGYGLVPRSIMRDPDLSFQAKAIYSYLASFAGNTGKAFPSTSLMSKELDMSRDTLFKYLKELKEKKVVTVERERTDKGTFDRNIYYLHNEVKKTPSPNLPDTVKPDTDKPDTDEPDTVNYDTNSNNLNSNNLNSNKENKAGIKFPKNSNQYILANQFREILLKYKSDSKVPANTEQGLQTWSQDIDYMMRLDKRDPRKILELIDWAQRDNFWCSNIRSPRKLRDKWDTLELQKNKANANGTKERVRTVENVQNEWEDFINGNF